MLCLFIVLSTIIKLSHQQYQYFPEEEQLQVINLNISLSQFREKETNLQYGLWSRFNPLGSISQVGSIGIFDSNCYNLFNILQQMTRRSNFLYYDCLDYQTKSIKKIVQFLDENEQQYSFILDLDQGLYENKWYLLFVQMYPLQKKFQFVLVLNGQILLFKRLEILFPFYDRNLIFTFGGGLSVTSQQRVETWNSQSLFSYFPGQIIGRYTEFDYVIVESQSYSNIQQIYYLNEKKCSCLKSMIEQFLDQNLQFIDLQIRTTLASDCNAFTFSGWIKALKIIHEDQNFLYKFIKISSNSENERLTHDNLSPFQLLYKFENAILFLQLIQIFKLTHFQYNKNLNWLKTQLYGILCQLCNMKISFRYKFNFLKEEIYQNQNLILLFIILNKQTLKYKSEIYLKNQNNYINMQIVSVSLIPCKMISQTVSCHQTCESCDGPTKNDCLNCNQDSKRIYILESKNCVCPDDFLEQDGLCLNFIDNQFSLVQYERPKLCEFGYFRYDDQTCIKCPLNLNSNTINCLECLQNPLTWVQSPICETQVLYNKTDSNVYKKIESKSFDPMFFFINSFFILDDDDLKFCINCDQTNFFALDQIFLDYLSTQNRETQLCLQLKDSESCNYCSLRNCVKCQVTFDRYICLKCEDGSQLINGKCQYLIKRPFFCDTPYYLNSLNQCLLCNIENCIYCFEYLENDILQNTLSSNFDGISTDDLFYSVGCALCQDSYQYNFIERKCLYEMPKIQNCLRTFVNQEGKEVCTLSNLQTFDLSPEIINCQLRIQNCEQCIKNNQQIIKCVLCEDGYVTNIISGKCTLCGLANIKKCIEGSQFIHDAWLILVQSFTMQLFENQFFLPKLPLIPSKRNQAISCKSGYQLILNYCWPICQPDCLECVLTFNFGFQCVRCPLNNSNKPQRFFNGQSCLKCPQLCSICEIRTEEEIKILNPQFILTEQNKLFTYKCIQKISDENVYIDPEFQIARLIFDDRNNILNFDYDFSKILENDGYQTNSKYYKDQINTEYCNSVGVDIIQVTFQFLFPQVSLQNIDNFDAKFMTILKQSIFSLKQTIFNLLPKDENFNILPGNLVINGFDQIKITRISFILSNQSSFIFQNESPIKMILNDIIFSTPQQKVSFNIQNNAFNEIILSNITFINLTIIDSSIFNIFGEYLEQSIQIFNIQIIGCQFTNSKFITIFNNSYPLFIQNLSIISSTFINSTILDITSQNKTAKEGYLNNFQIQKSKFNNSDSLKISNIEKFTINNLFISSSDFTTSIFYTINSNSKLNNLTIEESFLSTSSLIKSIDIFYGYQLIYEFYNFKIKNNRFLSSQILLITPAYQQQQQQLIVKLDAFDISNNSAQKSLIDQTQLFYIHCNILLITQIKISQQSNISIFYIHNTKIIKMNQLDYQNSIKKYKIPLGKNCQNDFTLFQIVKVFGFLSIHFEDFIINQLFTQDIAIIELISDTLYNKNEIEQINIKNIIFKENIILKQILGSGLSILLVYSVNKQSILLEDIKFLSNLFHQTTDDPLGLISGLIYFDSKFSDINITNIEIKYNGITNSSCSFLFFIAKTLSISNYQLEGLNIFDNNLLQNYISADFLNQEEILLIIEKILSIQTKGSACFATVSQLHIENGIFSKILSQTSSLFQIITQGEGIIILKDLIINNVDIIYDSNIELSGCINIYSQNSQLNLNLIGIQFIEVYNKFSPALLSITPSQKNNKIVLENINILNCLSLKNQIVYVLFSQEKGSQNYVFIKNIQINQTEHAWKQYFQKIGQLSYSNIVNVINDNALINLGSCSLVIQSLFVQGIVISPILKIENAIKLQIVTCKFIQIETFYSFNLIEIDQNNENLMDVIINDNEFSNIKLYQQKVRDELEKLILNDINYEPNCKIEIQNNLHFQKIRFSFQEIIQLIQNYETSSGSLINIQSSSNQTKVHIIQLKIQQTYCDFCKKGLVSVEALQISKLYFQEFYCVQNFILKLGCLDIQSKKIYKNQFTIRDSVLALNTGDSGVGITFSDIKGMIQNTAIFNNQANSMAGGINIQNDDFQIKKTQIFQNNADLCGGILLNHNTNLNPKNFIKSNLFFNKANKHPQNLVEAPTQLEIKINNKKQKSVQEIFENITTNFLTILNYKVKQQDLIINTGILMLPSNQIISKYKIFDLNTLQFRPYITEFSLIYLNNQQEQLGNFEDQNCTVFQNIISKNNRIVNKTQLFVVTFNNTQNSIDLGNLYFSFNPYDLSNYIQQIEIQCEINQFKTLIYILNTKSFLCQLGEFQTKNGCQVCDPNSGFYSVTYNATKCSIFDKNKFSNITSNTISLLPGFWRPNYLSDQTEQCIKQQNNCKGGWMIGDQSCLDGHLGGLCEECDVYNQRGSGFYFKNLQNGQCLLCNDNNSYIIIFVFVSFLAILSIMITIISIRKTNKLFVILKLRERFGKILFKLNQDHESFLIKMFLNYIWIFSLVFTYNISLSLNLNLIDQVSNTSQFMANNLDCYLSTITEINLIYIRIMATIFFIVAQFLVVCIIVFLIFQSQKFDFSNITNTILYLYLSNHASLTKQLCSLLTERIISNIAYVQGNVSLQFQSSSHQNWIFIFILPCLCLNACFIPFLLSSILYYRRNQLNQIQIRKYICYLFNEYNDNSYYWELIKIWQKTLLIFIMTYFEAEVFLKTTLLGLTLILYQFMASARKPYIILNLNKLDFETGQICCIALFLAAARSESVQQNRYQVSNILEVIIAFLCLLLIYFYVQNILVVYVKKYKFIVFSYLRTQLNKFSTKNRVTRYFEQKLLQQLMKKDKLNQNYQKLRAYLKQLITEQKFTSDNNSRHGTKFIIQDQRVRNQTFTSESLKSVYYSQKLI